jgi:hypothetical protein
VILNKSEVFKFAKKLNPRVNYLKQLDEENYLARADMRWSSLVISLSVVNGEVVCISEENVRRGVVK